MSKRSLYQCFNARCRDDRIVCDKGHLLVGVALTRLKRGEPLEYSICQNCENFDEMGGVIAKKDRGWRLIL